MLLQGRGQLTGDNLEGWGTALAVPQSCTYSFSTRIRPSNDRKSTREFPSNLTELASTSLRSAWPSA